MAKESKKSLTDCINKNYFSEVFELKVVQYNLFHLSTASIKEKITESYKILRNFIIEQGFVTARMFKLLSLIKLCSFVQLRHKTFYIDMYESS